MVLQLCPFEFVFSHELMDTAAHQVGSMFWGYHIPYVNAVSLYVHSQGLINALMLGNKEPHTAEWYGMQHISDTCSMVSTYFWPHLILKNYAKSKFCSIVGYGSKL